MGLFVKKHRCHFERTRLQEADIASLIDAANAAPLFAGDREDLMLTVLRSPAIMNQLDREVSAALPALAPQPTAQAPAAIAVSIRQGSASGGILSHGAFGVMEHMAHRAAELELGVIYIVPDTPFAFSDAFREAARLPETFSTVALLALGNTDEPIEDSAEANGKITVAYI